MASGYKTKITFKSVFVMSVQTRKLYAEFNAMAINSGINGISDLISAEDIYNGDYLMLKYYLNPILSVIHNKLDIKGESSIYASKRTRNARMFHTTYWVNVIDQYLGKKTSAFRKETVAQPKYRLPEPHAAKHPILKAYKFLIHDLLQKDYNMEESIMLNRMVNERKPLDVLNAMHEALRHEAYSIKYINAILESKDIKMNATIKKKIDINKKISASEARLLMEQESKSYTEEDISLMEETLENEKQSILLEMMLNSIEKSKDEK